MGLKDLLVGQAGQPAQWLTASKVQRMHDKLLRQQAGMLAQMQSPPVLVPPRAFARDEAQLFHRASARRISNGVVLVLSFEEGEVAQEIFVEDVSKLGEALVAALVARRVEK